MKRSDIWWAAAYGLLAVFTVLFCVTGGFAKVNTAYPYLAGFAQFAVYATAVSYTHLTLPTNSRV